MEWRQNGGRARVVAAGAIVLALFTTMATAAKDDTLLVSRAATVKGDQASLQAAISADGSRVAFASDATTLHSDDTDTIRDVFVHDLVTGAITLVSRTTAGAKGTSDSGDPALSADGRYVAWSSGAQLHADDGDVNSDVYVRDLQTGTTALVSRTSTGVKVNTPSGAPSISADGRYVAFQSDGKLHADDGDFNPDVYRRDLQTGTTVLVSRATGATGVDGNNFAEAPSISDDGGVVSFESTANNLDPGDNDSTRDVFVRDFEVAATTLVSRATGASGVKGNSASLRSAVSGNGRYVAFDSQANNLDPLEISGFVSDVYVRDLASSTTTLVSRATGPAGAKANGAALRPAISTDGQYVAFDSVASNLHPGDIPGAPRGVHVRDLLGHTTTLVSRAGGPSGDKSNADSLRAAISGSGRFVTFESLATNLDPADTDAISDIFARDVLGPADVTPPTIAAPPGITVEASGPGGTVVHYDSSASDDVAIATSGCVPASGSTFVIGSTAVTCTATDTSANTNTATFVVTVADRQPPALALPVSLSARATGPAGAVVQYGASASDAVGVASFACVPPSGATFPVGTTRVTCIATDGAGNRATGSFAVTIGAAAASGGSSLDRLTAKLGLSRAVIVRSRRRLEIVATISRLASGRITVEVRAAGRRDRFVAPIRNGRIRISRRLSRKLASAGSGIVTLSYPGDADTRPQQVRLRAAPRAARLRGSRPTLTPGGRLRAGGTIARSARGVVRVELEYVHLGQTKTRSFSARIRRGRWRLDLQVPNAVVAEIGARTGTVHAYTVFAGYGPRAIRGELRSSQVLGTR